MTQLAYMSVTGAKQGVFKAQSTLVARQDKWIPILAFEMALESPRDSNTGLASGKRRFLPLRIVKEWGAASAQALSACAANEALREVTFEFERAKAHGPHVVFETVKLTNASITSVVRAMGRPSSLAEGAKTALAAEDKALGDPLSWEEWTFVFQRIEVVDVRGQTSFTGVA